VYIITLLILLRYWQRNLVANSNGNIFTAIVLVCIHAVIIYQQKVIM
jgi:hypothetical protein